LVIAVVLSYYSVVETTEVSSSNVPTDIYLVLDRSGSMGDPSGSSSTKIEDAKKSASEFVNIIAPDINSNFTIGLIAFSDDAEVVVHLTHDTSALSSAIGSLAPLENTAMSDALKLASEMLMKEGTKGAQSVIVLMSDGLTNADKYSTPNEAADLAIENGIQVYTVAFGSDADASLLQLIASRTGGQYYYASTGADLVKSFSTIAQTLLTVSPAAHYGSRLMVLSALPLVVFLPQIERGVTLAYEGLTTMLRKQPTTLKRDVYTRAVCSRCEFPIRPGAAFCSRCGLRLGRAGVSMRCRGCGTPLRAGARFCKRCGSQV
jgi:uncharacterized protein YegL